MKFKQQLLESNKMSDKHVKGNTQRGVYFKLPFF